MPEPKTPKAPYQPREDSFGPKNAITGSSRIDQTKAQDFMGVPEYAQDPLDNGVTMEDIQEFMQGIPEDQMQEMIAQQDGFTQDPNAPPGAEGQAPPEGQAPQPGAQAPPQQPGVV